MKQYIVNRSGQTPTLEKVPNNSIAIYDSLNDAQTDFSNIENNAIISAGNALWQKKNNVLKPICKGDGIAVGSLISMENNNQTPAGYLLCDGSTFDETEYPLLYAYLGSNKLPEVRNNKNVSNWIELTSQTVPNVSNYTSNPNFVGFEFISQYQTFQTGISTTIYQNVGSYSNTQFSHDGTNTYNYALTINWSTGNITSNLNGLEAKAFRPIYLNNTFKYIKAVSGIETASTEAEEVTNALNVMKAYTRNQNVLGDWENITVSTDPNNPTIFLYDGFYYFNIVEQGTAFNIYINEEHIGYTGTNALSRSGYTFPIKKGDRIYITGNSTINFQKVRYYKLRDYSD